jgi:hypothetical protein
VKADYLRSERMTADEALMLLQWMTEDRDKLWVEHDRYRAALERIAKQDYRLHLGARHRS